jgi:hypothetical protein
MEDKPRDCFHLEIAWRQNSPHFRHNVCDKLALSAGERVGMVACGYKGPFDGIWWIVGTVGGATSPLEWLPLSVLTDLESERLQKVNSPSILGLELNLMVECGTIGINKRWTRGLVFISIVGFTIDCENTYLVVILG